MKKTTLHPNGHPTYTEAEPRHNKDRCYLCGKCLHCEQDKPCRSSESYGAPHWWLDNSELNKQTPTMDGQSHGR